MKNVLFYIFSLILFASCSLSDKEVKIEGKFSHLDKGEFFIFTESSAWASFDTIKVEGGEFSYIHEISSPTIITVQYPNFSQMTIIAEPGKTIKIKGDARNLSSAKITGTPDNEELTKFRISVKDKSSDEAARDAQKYILKHPESLASEAILRVYMLKNKQLNAELLTPVISAMEKAQKKNLRLITTIANLRPLLTYSTGKKLPSISFTSLNGKSMTTDFFKGKFLLITFMAEWSQPSLNMERELSSFLRSYSKNEISELKISLDFDKDALSRHIAADSLGGTYVCDGLAWESPIVKAFGCDFVPGNIFINPQGVVIARNMELEELKNKVKQTIN